MSHLDISLTIRVGYCCTKCLVASRVCLFSDRGVCVKGRIRAWEGVSNPPTSVGGLTKRGQLVRRVQSGGVAVCMRGWVGQLNTRKLKIGKKPIATIHRQIMVKLIP